MSWEDVPGNPTEAHRLGYGLGDCPFKRGSHEEGVWRVWWIQAEADHQDIRTNSLEAAAQVHPSTLPRKRTEVDALIDSFDEPEPAPPPEPPPIEPWFPQVFAMGGGAWTQVWYGNGYSIDFDPTPKPVPLVQWKWPDVRSMPAISVPRSATQIAARVRVTMAQGLLPDRRIDHLLHQQTMIEERAKAACRARMANGIRSIGMA